MATTQMLYLDVAFATVGGASPFWREGDLRWIWLHTSPRFGEEIDVQGCHTKIMVEEEEPRMVSPRFVSK